MSQQQTVNNAPMRMVNNLASLGHVGNLKKEDVLSLGVSGDILETIGHFTQGGTFRLLTRNLEGVCHAFSQLKLHPLTIDDLLPLDSLGTLTPPTPHLGIIERNARNSNVWIRA